MKILVTGFTPFGGETVNPSWEAVRALEDLIAGADIIKCEIRPNLKLPLMRSRLQSTHINQMPSSVSDSSAAVHPFRSNASPSICGTPAPPITQASSRTTSRLLTARLTPFFRRFRPGRSQIGSAQLGFPLRSPTPPGLMYATTCSMLRYMKARRQKKETLRAAVLSMFPICPIRLLLPFPMLPV